MKSITRVIAAAAIIGLFALAPGRALADSAPSAMPHPACSCSAHANGAAPAASKSAATKERVQQERDLAKQLPADSRSDLSAIWSAP